MKKLITILLLIAFTQLQSFDTSTNHNLGASFGVRPNSQEFIFYRGWNGKDGETIKSSDGTGYNISLLYQYRKTENVKLGIMIGFTHLENSFILKNIYTTGINPEPSDRTLDANLNMSNVRVFLEYNFWNNFNLSFGVNKIDVFSSSAITTGGVEIEKVEILVLEKANFHSQEQKDNPSLLDNAMIALDYRLSYDINFELSQTPVSICPEIGYKNYVSDLVQGGDWRIDSYIMSVSIKMGF